MNKQTFVIIKPDAITFRFVGKIISRFEDMGLRIQHIEERHKNEQWCRAHYQHILEYCRIGTLEKIVYQRLEKFMTTTPTIGIILLGESAIFRVKKAIGVTNALTAEPGTIRGDWGQQSGCYNLVHAADSEEAVKEEIKLYFDKETDQ